MASGHYNPEPIQTQPQWQNKSTSAYQDQQSVPTAVVPPGLECLVEVEEVILKKKVFQTNSGQTLFSVRRETECFGPALNLKLRDPYKRDVVSLYLVSSGDCCGGQTYLRIETVLQRGLGYVTIDNTSRELNVSIQMANKEPVFTARMPVYMDPRRDNTIEILSVNGNYPVVQIQKKREHKSSQVIFRFPLNLDASLKAVILATFLYMTFRVNQITSRSSTSVGSGWATSGGVVFVGGMHYGVSNMGHDSGHCGGGEWGGGSGDCGGGGGDYGGGGGGGDCGGGGGCGGE
ncbi:phospholipid scramblase 2-like isoform X4 [Mixophyes fleayi]|uniref:phospholipid scramblase 2-like isoform X4 n=1 Tax=Mixophyes fleayi TaxID=3061075 RepID=UPI003F4E1A35